MYWICTDGVAHMNKQHFKDIRRVFLRSITISRSLQLVYFLTINTLYLEQLLMELLIAHAVARDLLKLNAHTVLKMACLRKTQETFVWLKLMVSGLSRLIMLTFTKYKHSFEYAKQNIVTCSLDRKRYRCWKNCCESEILWRPVGTYWAIFFCMWGTTRSNREMVYQEANYWHKWEPAISSREESPDLEDYERSWCYCNQPSYGTMIGCDNSECTIQWFHCECLRIRCPPKGKWYCPSSRKLPQLKKTKKD